MLGTIKLIKKDHNYGLIESDGKTYMILSGITDDLSVGTAVSFDKIENGRFEQAINIKKQ